MKKSYLTLAAVAAIMASCSNEVLIDQIETPEVAIGFETFNNKATKAENSNASLDLSLFDHHPSFAVWGYKDVQTDGYVFGTSNTEGTVVNGSKGAGDKVTWSYSPLRFWDKNANRYDFYAAAPVTADDTKPMWTLVGDATSDKQQVNYFTLDNVVLEDKTLIETEFTEVMKSNAQTNIDYMIASDNHADNPYPDKVQLTFNHILSRLNVTAKVGSSLKTIADDNADDAKLEIVAIEVHDMIAKGSFNEHANIVGTENVFDNEDKLALQAGTIKRWSLDNTSKVTYTAFVESDEAKNLTVVDTDDEPIYMLQSLVMPQNVGYEILTRDGKDENGVKIGENGCSISKPYLYIEYKIGTEYKVKAVTTGASVKDLYTLAADSYNKCAPDAVAVEGTTYYEYNGKPETFKAYYNLAAAFGAGTYKTVVVEEGASVKGYYTKSGDTYTACADDATASSGTTYYRLVADEISFNEGWQNKLNLTIDVDAIVLDANVYKWADGEINDLDVK